MFYVVNCITPSDFKEFFIDDFDYLLVSDCHIKRAFMESKMQFNPSLFEWPEEIRVAFFYLSAHNLVLSLRNSDTGVRSTSQLPVTRRTVGSINEEYSVPTYLLNNPILNGYQRTEYGMQYLAIIAPRIIGNVRHTQGTTRID